MGQAVDIFGRPFEHSSFSYGLNMVYPDIKKLYVAALKKKHKLSNHPYRNMPKEYVRIKYDEYEIGHRSGNWFDACVLFMP